MKILKAFFFKYHKLIGLILAIPVCLTAITGMGSFIFDDVIHQEETAEFLLKIHTMEILGIEDIYVFVVGIGLLWMIISGLIMSGVFKKKSK